MLKAISPLVGTVLLIAFAIGVGGIVTIFLTGVTKTSTGITQNASESLTLCSAAAINIPKDSVYCVSGYKLIGLWRLDEGSGTTAADSSGYGNNGVLTNSPVWTAGRYGNGLEFDGVNDYVNISHNDLLNTPEGVTLSAWVKLNGSQGTFSKIAAKDKSGGKYDYALAFQSGSNDKLYFLSNDNVVDYSVISTSDLPQNVWTHVAGTYDGTTMRLYINGVENNSTTASFTIRTVAQPFTIGQGGGFYFNGTIDEVRLYNRSLSASEIKQHYESGITELFGDKSVVKFQLKNNGQYNLGRNFYFLLSTSAASNATAINLSSDLTPGTVSLVTLANLTLSALSASSVQNMHITSSVCPNVQLTLKDLGTDC